MPHTQGDAARAAEKASHHGGAFKAYSHGHDADSLMANSSRRNLLPVDSMC
jgi:hypothetical protein